MVNNWIQSIQTVMAIRDTDYRGFPLHSRANVQVPYLHSSLTHCTKHGGMEWRPHHIIDWGLQ